MKTVAAHPLDPLTADEVLVASTTVRKYLAEQTTAVKAIKFLYITLIEPPKADVLQHLGIATSAAAIGKTEPQVVEIPRKADVSCVDLVAGEAYNAEILLTGQTGQVVSLTKLPEGVQPGITLEELCESEEAVRKDARCIALAKEVGVEAHQLYADGWSIGWDTRFGNRRLQQCLLYARLEQHDNLYAHPMDFFPVVDSNTLEVIHVDFAAHRDSTGKLSVDDTGPPDPSSDAIAASGRQRIPPPLRSLNYLPEYLEGKDGFKMRDDIKPLHVIQPEGVSFSMNGNVLSWQNWKMHIGWNYREGVVLSTITYNDKGAERPIVYRMSMAEMVVPYGAPEHPHPRKFAADVGEYGMGMLANSLELGCDCLGTIKYIDGVNSGHDGKPVVVKNAICIHEEDGGILYKHTDFRPGGRAHAVRSRKLLIQFTATVANYEYILVYAFKQDGTFENEVKLTGILNLYLLQQGEDVAGLGTEIAPRVMAHNHQHLFSLRVDPMIDGLANSLYESNVHAFDEPTGSKENFAGNGFYYKKTLLDTTEKAIRDWNSEQGRTWLIGNQDHKHYASGSPVSYKIMGSSFPKLFAKADSWVSRRMPFARHHLWAAPYVDGQIYPSGKYVPQTHDAPEDSLLSWTKPGQNLEQKDLVLYITFGVTHVPRPEDAPVMPVETAIVMFKPVGFFDANPALDVPSSKDKKSYNAFESVPATNGTAAVNGTNGSVNGTNGTNGCCH